MAKVKLHLNRY